MLKMTGACWELQSRRGSRLKTSDNVGSGNVKWMLLAISVLLLKIKYTISVDFDEEIKQYCRERDRLVTSEEADDFLLVDAELNSTIKLQCHFCNEIYNEQPKIWFWQNRYKSEEKEVEIGMDNNMYLNRIRVTPQLSLIIKDFNQNDSGIYRCHGKEGQEVDQKFNYKLEAVYKDESTENLPRGNLTDWQKYHETNLAPVTMRFSISKMKEIALIRNSGINLELVSEWGSWSPCEKCKFGKGQKTSLGLCRIKSKINEKIAKDHNESSIIFFRSSPLLPCRSIALNDFPGISSATRYLPDFILEKKCKKCKKPKKIKDKFKYKRRYVLHEGSHLSINCPESSLVTQIVWRKDGFVLEKGKGHSFRKKDPEPRVFVDTFSTLYLKEVSEFEDGKYTCFVDNIKMMQAKVIVILNSKLLTEVFKRHLAYLGFIIILSSFCYCSGLVAVFKRRDKFEIQDYKEIQDREGERKPFFDAKD